MQDEAELTILAARLGAMLVKGMGVRSRWALRTALDAHDTEGVAGICVFKIPPREKDYVDVSFTIGFVDIVSRWGEMG